VATRRARSEARILDAAAELLEVHGYAATTMEMIADQAGVGVATVYNRFKSKAQLAGRVLMARKARPQRLGEGNRPIQDQIRDYVDEIASQLAGDGSLRSRGAQLLNERSLQGIASALAPPLAELVRAGQVRGEIRPELDPRDVATLATNLLVVRLAGREEAAGTAASAVVDLILWGVAGR
jgi:AcrR family transcriptional regulator